MPGKSNAGEPNHLLERTYALLNAAASASYTDGRLTRREIAEKSGVDYNWLQKFAQYRIDDPGVRKVQRVHDYLRPLVELRQ